MALASVAVGLFVGVLSGMLGIGGGTILVPVFKLGYAMESIACTATSLFTIIPTSVSGAISHIRNKTCVPKLGVAAGLGGAVTSPLGVYLASLSPGWAIMIAAAVIVAYSAVTMLKKAVKMRPAGKASGVDERGAGAEASRTEARGAGVSGAEARGAEACGANASGAEAREAGIREAGVETSGVEAREAKTREDKAHGPATGSKQSSCIPPAPPMSAKQLAQGACIGLAAGLASGYVGVGGGFLMVPLMIQIIGTPMKLTSGTSLIAVMILAVPGVCMQAALGNVNWVAGIAVACGSIPGAALGARLVPRIPERTLRFVFSGFLFFAAIMLVLNQLGIV